MTNKRTLLVAFSLLALCSCKVGPNYKRPALNVPDQYRSAPSPEPSGDQFAQMKWWTVFQDETLQALIKEALANNYDMRIAAARVLEANANLGIVRANQFPQANGSFGITNEHNFEFYGKKSPTFDIASLSLSYIVDFWGQYRRATESARASLLATKYGQEVVQVTLISSVASDYFLLRQYDAQLNYATQTVETDKEILNLNNIKFKGGESAITDVYQAQTLLEQSEAEVITLQQVIAQTENNLSILLGRNPGPIRARAESGGSAALARSAPRACHPPCCNAVPTCAARRKIWSRPTPTLASPRPPSSRRFRSPASSGRKALPSPASCKAPRRFGRWAGRSSSPSFREAASPPTTASPGRNATKPSSPTSKPCCRPSAMSPTAWLATRNRGNTA